METPNDRTLSDRLQVLAGCGDAFAAAVRATHMPMLITDPRQNDNPIAFANEAFLRLCGYDRSEVIGHNCRFLQGAETDPAAIEAIRSAIASQEEIAVDILNYRKDGTSFWNALYMSPVTDEAGELLFFFASQLDVTDRKRAEIAIAADRDRIEAAVALRTHELEAALTARTELLHEVDHRVKNNLQLVAALILIESRLAKDGAAAASLARLRDRVAALSVVHRLLDRERDIVRFDIDALIREFAAEAAPAGAPFEFDLDRISVAAAYAAPVALLTSELMRIALARNDGIAPIKLGIERNGPGCCRFSISGSAAGDTRAAPISPDERSFIDRLGRQLRATITWPDLSGQAVSVDLPIDEQTRRG